MRFVAFILVFATPMASAQQPTNGFCVENGDTRAALFAVDVGAKYHDIATLATGERLCTPEFPDPTNGFVSVFYDESAIEGCSRLTPAGALQVLVEYRDFDNCTWLVPADQQRIPAN